MRVLRSFRKSFAPVVVVGFTLAAIAGGCGGSGGGAGPLPEEDGGGMKDATSDGLLIQHGDGSVSNDSPTVDDAAGDGTTGSADSSGTDSGEDDSSAASDGAGDSESGTPASDAENGSDSTSEASTEAGAACPTGAACALDGGNGLCAGGACTECTDPSSDTACSEAYGDGGTSGHICSAGSCVPGNCRTDTDCNGGICGLVTAQFCGGCTTDAQCQSDASYGPATICDTATKKCVSSACTTVGAACSSSGDICCPGTGGNACVTGNCCSDTQCSGTKPACNTITNTCAACDALGASPAHVVVDPVNGKDVVGNGSGTVGGTVADGACAFKTITFALGNLGTATDVRVLPTGQVGTATNGEQFPLTVPAGVTIEGFGGPVTVNEVATGDGSVTGVAFTLSAAGSTLSNLIIDGGMTGVHGVRATTNSTLATNIVNVEVRNFTSAGIRVELSGKLTINSGTNAHNNGTAGTEPCGLHVTGQAQAVITGGAVPIQFNQNTQHGILVDGDGTVTITGTPGTGTTGSVVANGNLVDGIEITQINPTLNTITGLVAAVNADDGARFYGPSSVQVRNSVFVGNENNGVNILPFGAGANQNSVATMDLGTASSPGGNTFQSAANPNAFAGICLDIQANQSQTLQAQGNLWEGGDGGVLSCGVAALTENANKGCANGKDIGGSGLSATVGATSNGIDVASCTCVSGGTTCK
jgi:hypothetical protein